MTDQEQLADPPAPERIAGLDVTRGFAVMGILAMNIVAMAMPENAYISPLAWGEGDAASIWTWAINFVLIDSKFRGLFSMMFGASTLLVLQSAVAAGRRAGRAHYARMIVLMLFGLAHFYLIWFGDILFIYGAIGCILFLFRNMATKRLVKFGIGFIAANTLLSAAMFGVLVYGGQPGAPQWASGPNAEVTEDFRPDSKGTLRDVAVYRSGLTAIVAEKTKFPQILAPIFSLAQFGMETLGLMLIGMALFRSGLLQGQWTRERLALWRNRCLAAGISVNVLLLAWQLHDGLRPATLLLTTFALSVPFDVIMTIGYAALFMGLAQRFADSALIGRVAAAGRAAFTNYLGSSILMTGIFYGWGLGLFGTIERAPLYLFVIGAWALMLLWSRPWLDRFHFGPLEWLWRSLARLSPQPMRKSGS